MQPLGVTAFGGRAGPLVVQVEVLDVEGEDFLRAGGGLVQPPQTLLPDGDASRRNSRSSEVSATALVRSVLSGRRSRPAQRSTCNRPVRRQNAVNERSVRGNGGRSSPPWTHTPPKRNAT